MSNTLPPLKSTLTGSTASSPRRCKLLELPFKPVTTKAEKYAELVKFDQYKLKRKKAYFKNALKTTEGLDRVARQLERVSCTHKLIDCMHDPE